MPKFGGGHEDFEAERRELEALRRQREQLIAREQAYQREVGQSIDKEDDAARRREVGRRRRVEAEDVGQREARTAGTRARQTEVDTAAIERNTRARQRQAEATRRARADTDRAFRGARDPLFGQTTSRLASGESQYAARRALQIGQERIRRMQEALTLGYRPDEVSGSIRRGPLTRVAAARAGVADADVGMRQARAAYDVAVRNAAKENTVEARAAAQAANEKLAAAQAARASAKAELQSAEAAQAEAAARTQATAAARESAAAAVAGRQPGSALIRHPQLYGQPGYGEAQATRGVVGGSVVPGRPFRPGYGAPPGARPPAATSEAELERQAEQRSRALSGAYAREAASKGQVTQASRAYLGAMGAEQRLAAESLVARNTAYRSREAALLQQTQRATQGAAAGYGTLSQAMHRHGALTSEFILAASRGEASLRELGNQSIVTAGKFAGWTAAATAVYGAVAAIGRMGKGAIDASSGVNTLRRVINNVDSDQAQTGFAQLAQRFNVPIDTVVDAVYRMGQRFHDLPDAMKAAESSLYSFKTGEVDVAESTQYLIAIVNGFGLTAQDLQGVYDQINQAQNTFGIRIGDTEQGLAKAAGTYRNAGGDLNYLLGLFVAISQATGRSGTEIGTGIARGVNQFRLPSHVTRLGAQGVQVDTSDFQSTLQSAFKAAKRPGADLHEIATGLLGNQYARLIEPVLRDQDRLNKALADTSPERSKGSAQRELATTLKSVREQVAAIGINLERLGAELNRAGAFTVFGGLLKILNQTLDTTGDLVEAFNRLPAPLRQAIVLGAQLYGTMALLRKFGATDRFRGGPLGFIAGSGDRRLRTSALRGLRDFRDESRNEAERSGLGAFRARHAEEITRQRARDYGQDIGRRVETGALVPFSPQFMKEQERLRVLQLNSGQAAARAAEAADQAYEANRITMRAEQTYSKAAGLRGRALREFMAAEGIAYPRQLDAPNTRGTGLVGSGRPLTGTQRELQLLYREGGLSTRQYKDALDRNMTVRGAQLQRRMGDLTAAETRFGRTLDQTAGFMRIGGRQLDFRRSIPVIAANASRAERALASARGIPARVGSSISTITAGIGVLDAALIAFIGLEIAGSSLRKQQEKLDKVAALVDQQPLTTTAARSRTQKLQAAANKQGPGIESDLLQSVFEEINFKNLIGSFTGSYMSPAERADAVRELAQKELNAQQDLLANQARQRDTGGPVGNLFASQVYKNVSENLKDLASGALTMSQFRKELKERAIEAEHSVRIGPRGQADLWRRIQAAGRQALAVATPGNFYGRFAQAPADEIRKNQQTTIARMSQVGYRSRRSDFAELRAEYRYLAQRTRSASSPEELQKLTEDQGRLFDSIVAVAQREAEESLLFARTESQRRGVYARQRAQIESIPVAARSNLQDERNRLFTATTERNKARQAREAAEAAVAAAPVAAGIELRNPLTAGSLSRSGAIADARRALTAARRRERTAGGNLRREKEAVDKAEAAYRDSLRRRRIELAKLRDEEYGDRQQGREALAGLRQSQTADSAEKAAIAIRFAAQQVRDASRTYGRGSRQYRQALTELNNAYQQQAQDAVQSIQAQGALAQARAGSDPIAQARATLGTARSVLAFMRQNSRRFDPDEIVQAQAEVINAQNAIQDAIRQQAETLRNLRQQIAQARAEGNPVAQARIAIRYAREAQRVARTPEERLQATLDLINANNELESAVKDREAARFELLAASTDDPVEKARIERNAARRAIRGTQGAERYRAVASYREAQRTLRDARLSKREDDIDFDLEMDKITREDAINRYTALLRLHNLTREQRRDILRKIKGLKDDAESEAEGFNLDVGNIKLPTLYDVRRALRGVRDQVRDARAQNIRANTNVTVNVEVNDPNAAGRVYDAIDDALSTGVSANMRSAGLT
jgi:TP901 family phage tail tape measure protein